MTSGCQQTHGLKCSTLLEILLTKSKNWVILMAKTSSSDLFRRYLNDGNKNTMSQTNSSKADESEDVKGLIWGTAKLLKMFLEKLKQVSHFKQKKIWQGLVWQMWCYTIIPILKLIVTSLQHYSIYKFCIKWLICTNFDDKSMNILILNSFRDFNTFLNKTPHSFYEHITVYHFPFTVILHTAAQLIWH